MKSGNTGTDGHLFFAL